MLDTTLHIGKHFFISLFRSFPPSVVNPCQQLVLVEIEFLAFLVSRKQPFAYQCIYGRLSFSDDTASVLNLNQHVFV